MTGHLSALTWCALADEYLDDRRPDPAARENAVELARYVDDETLTFDDCEPLEISCATVPWVPVDNPEPYTDLSAMRREFQESWETSPAGRLKVSDCYHDHPVWGRLDTLRFRVWHDTGHITENLGFDRVSELELFRRQAAKLPTIGLRHALFSESVYQLAAAVHLGDFPDRQYVRSPGPVATALLDAWGLNTVWTGPVPV